MWLRQVALVAHDLKPVVEQLGQVFGLKVAYEDPAVGVFGLINAVMPAGGEFLEVVQPVKDDASALRYLRRRGGDAGYMVILQTADAAVERARILGLGARKIAEHDGSYVFTHFHPGDFCGVLTSVDSVTGVENWFDRDSDWPPAGRDWHGARSAGATALVGVSIQSRTPDALARRWGELLGVPAKAGERGPELDLARGVIRFIAPVDEDASGVVGVDIVVPDAARVLDIALRHNVPVKNDTIKICGVDFNLMTPSRAE